MNNPRPVRSERFRFGHRFILLGSLAALCHVPMAHAADALFTSGAFTGDADSGVGTTKLYTTAANIIGSDVTVNGVTFVGSGTALSGTGWELTNTPNLFGGGGNKTTTFGASVIDNLFDGFQYNGNPSTLTMSGLTAGQTYTVTLYNQSWTLGAIRSQTFTSSEGVSTVFDQDALEASLLRYSFVATGATTTINVAPQTTNPVTSMHFYGVSNEQVFTNTWTPALDSTWNSAGNWSGGGAPNGIGTNASFAPRPGATSVNLETPVTVGHVQFQGAGDYTVTGADVLTFQADLAGASILKADTGATHTIAVPVQLNSPVAKFGGGTLRFTAAVTGTGKGATIGSGRLELANNAADLSGIGPVTNRGVLAIESAGNQKLDAIITGTGALEKRGAGVLTLGGYQEYTGATVIQQGTLKLASATSVAVANSSFETYTALANGSFGYTPAGASWTFTGAGIALNGSPWFGPTNHDGAAGGFIQSNASGAGSISQAVNVTEAGFYNLQFQGVARGGGLGPSALLVRVDGTTLREINPAEFSPAGWGIYNVGLNLTPGAHTIEFLGKNVTGGDRSVVIDAVSLSTGGRLSSNTAVNLTGAGATLDLSGFSQTVGSLAGVAGSTVVNSGGLVAGGDGTSTVFAGSLSGAGGFTKAGAGTMQITGVNTYAGSTTVSGGTLELVGGTIPATALNLTGSGANLVTNGAALTVASLAGVGSTTVNLGEAVLTVGDATTTQYLGSLTADGVTKVGTGRTELYGPTAVTGPVTVSGGGLKMAGPNTGTISVANVAAGASWDLGVAPHTVGGLTGAGLVTRSGSLSTGPDGAALISSAKNYLQKLDFGNGTGATVNDVTFDTVGTNGPGHTLTGAGVLFGENATLTGYDQLVNDFYYNGNPGTLTFTNLTPGQIYEAVLYTKVGHWPNRTQNATFDEDGAGPASSQLLGTDPGTVGYYAYRFVAQNAAMSVTMAPANAGNTFHWFAASLESVNAPTPTLTIGDATDYAFTGVINGGTRLVKQGTGIQELSGASDFVGGTAITGGVIMAHHAQALGTGSVDVAAGANYLAWWRTGSPVVSNNFVLNGTGGPSPGGSKAIIYADGGPINGFAEYTLAGTVTLNASSNVGGNAANNLRILGPISGPGGLIKGGGRSDENNTLILGNPANAYAGDTLITKGTVKLANHEVIPHGASAGTVTVNAGTTFDLGGFNETVNGLSGTGLITSTSAVGVAVAFTTDAGTGISTEKTYTHALDFAEGTPVSVNGVEFTGAGLTGATWSLTGANPVAGNGATGATGDISRLLTNFYYGGNPATLTLSGLTAGQTYETRLYHRRWGGDRNQLFTVTGQSGSGTTIFDSDATGQPSYLPLRFTANASGQATVTTNAITTGTYHWYGLTNEAVAAPVLTVAGSQDTTFGGNISSNLELTKAGTGKLILSGTSTYTGITNVNAGTLQIDGSLSGTQLVAVNGGVLGGSGTIHAGASVSVAATGTVAPGSSIGTLQTGPISFAADSTLALEIGATTGDQLSITGGAFIAGNVNLTLSLLADPVDFTAFTVINGTSLFGGFGDGGRFRIDGNVLEQGETFSVVSGIFSQDFQINYAADGGNDVVLTAVPEPGIGTLFLSGLAGFVGLRRRRRA